VTAVADGVTVISVSAGGVTKTVDVRVRLGIPYVLSITPNALMSLATPVQFQLTGWNLGGISWVNFVFQGTNDGNFVVTNLQVNVDGTIATGTLIVATNAVFGPRTIIVTTSGGLSSSIPMTGNIFATKPSIGLGNLSVTIQNATNTYTKLDVLSPAELSVVLQVSPDLVTWVSVRTNIGSFQYLETNSAPHSTRFFRALTSP
jgi:hypothetical protein